MSVIIYIISYESFIIIRNLFWNSQEALLIIFSFNGEKAKESARDNNISKYKLKTK